VSFSFFNLLKMTEKERRRVGSSLPAIFRAPTMGIIWPEFGFCAEVHEHHGPGRTTIYIILYWTLNLLETRQKAYCSALISPPLLLSILLLSVRLALMFSKFVRDVCITIRGMPEFISRADYQNILMCIK